METTIDEISSVEMTYDDVYVVESMEYSLNQLYVVRDRLIENPNISDEELYEGIDLPE
jgi:hypothetical protein